MPTVPYSYHLHHLPTDKHYYGIRFAKKCNPRDLWVKYFSSSKVVKKLIQTFGKESFEVTVRRIFTDGASALLWEHRVLTKLHAASRSNWINRHDGGKKFRSPEHHSTETKERLRLKITGMKRSAATKEKLAASARIREDKRREEGWKMPVADVLRRADAKRGIPRFKEIKEKISQSKLGTKRKYLPDGTFIMVRP